MAGLGVRDPRRSGLGGADIVAKTHRVFFAAVVFVAADAHAEALTGLICFALSEAVYVASIYVRTLRQI